MTHLHYLVPSTASLNVLDLDDLHIVTEHDSPLDPARRGLERSPPGRLFNCLLARSGRADLNQSPALGIGHLNNVAVLLVDSGPDPGCQ